MKVNINSNGINYMLSSYFDTLEKDFNSAITKASSLSCPSSFGYYSYISGLSNNLIKLKKKITSIESLLLHTEKTYKEFFNDEKNTIKTVKDPDIVVRTPNYDLEKIM